MRVRLEFLEPRSVNDERPNELRAEEMAEIVNQYGENNGFEDNAIDLMADLMHAIRSKKLSFNKIVKIARTHYNAER